MGTRLVLHPGPPASAAGTGAQVLWPCGQIPPTGDRLILVPWPRGSGKDAGRLCMARPTAASPGAGDPNLASPAT
jgi:hypothetical protein